MKRAAILCPGRGSYTEKTLGSLPLDHPWVRRADERRRARGLASLATLDRAQKFEAATHLSPVNASGLIWLVSMLDAAAAASEHEIVCVAGNSMGWYTALAAAGALSFDDGFRLVQEMAILQEKQQKAEGGGQVLYPLVDDRWKTDAKLETAVRVGLAESKGEARLSIRLGGYAVLAGTEAGIAHLLRALPKVKLGQNLYPFRLMQHGAYHTPIVASVAESARELLPCADDDARRRTRGALHALVDGSGGARGLHSRRADHRDLRLHGERPRRTARARARSPRVSGSGQHARRRVRTDPRRGGLARDPQPRGLRPRAAERRAYPRFDAPLIGASLIGGASSGGAIVAVRTGPS